MCFLVTLLEPARLYSGRLLALCSSLVPFFLYRIFYGRYALGDITHDHCGYFVRLGYCLRSLPEKFTKEVAVSAAQLVCFLSRAAKIPRLVISSS
ncbi:hypothetical protein Zmor_008989 [Zophobas morio]|uniref:Uncharacterized protein n=1 Tax=Zophobas morio TaxID=2755281 RepID=A0AA38M0D3_9CUCU|nr:hypothetical protein Zmor_008989 [Zophobas morio]